MGKQQTLFSKRLKDARTKAGLTQRKLGLKAGLSIENADVRINQYETQGHIPRFPVTVEIAKALNIPTSYFYEPDGTIAKAILDLGSLNARDRKAAVEYIGKLKKQ